MAKVLITRTSSFGDVAMLVPVIFSVAARYPQDRFTILTRKAFSPLFENLGFNIGAMPFDPDDRHKGIFGMFRLLLRINNNKYTHVADMHDVLRTKFIRTYMKALGKKVSYVDKGRNEKNEMIRTKKTDPPLKNTIQRYIEVFEDLGFPAEMIFNNYFEFNSKSLYPLRNIVTEKKGKWIGIAPFSKHEEKVYPIREIEKVVESLSKKENTSIFLFGSGIIEKNIFSEWEKKYPNLINIAGRVNLINELLLISYLDVMVSMDSANMHLASLVQVPTISIWGATHPSLGFYGFKQDLNNAIQTDIECRPCSVYGEIPCVRGDFACLTRIDKTTIINKVCNLLSLPEEIIPEDEEPIIKEQTDLVSTEEETIVETTANPPAKAEEEVAPLPEKEKEVLPKKEIPVIQIYEPASKNKKTIEQINKEESIPTTENTEDSITQTEEKETKQEEIEIKDILSKDISEDQPSVNKVRNKKRYI